MLNKEMLAIAGGSSIAKVTFSIRDYMLLGYYYYRLQDLDSGKGLPEMQVDYGEYTFLREIPIGHRIRITSTPPSDAPDMGSSFMLDEKDSEGVEIVERGENHGSDFYSYQVIRVIREAARVRLVRA